MDKINELKMSSELRNKIKASYKKEKNKPEYKVRKILETEIEFDVRVLAAVLAIAILTPTIDSIYKFKELTKYKIEVSNFYVGENIDETN